MKSPFGGSENVLPKQSTDAADARGNHQAAIDAADAEEITKLRSMSRTPRKSRCIQPCPNATR